MSPLLEHVLIVALCIALTVLILKNILLIGSFFYLLGAVLLFIICSPIILIKKVMRWIKGADKDVANAASN